MRNKKYDRVVFVHCKHDSWWINGSVSKTFFICSEMFLNLEDIERRRWELWHLLNIIKAADLPVATLADFLLAEDIAWIENTSKYISKQWYRNNNIDWSNYRGISLGHCCEYEMQAKIMRRLKFALAVQRVHERFPDCLVFSDYLHESEEYLIMVSLGLQVWSFDTGSMVPSVPEVIFKRITHIDWKELARYWGIRLLKLYSNIMNRLRPLNKPIVLFHITSHIMNALSVWQREPMKSIQVSIVASDLLRPKQAMKLVKSGAIITKLPHGKEPLFLDQVLVIKSRWEVVRVSACFDKICTPGGMFLQHVFNRLFDCLVQKKFAMMCISVDNAYATLGNSRVSLLVVPQDAMFQARLETLVTRKLGKRTMVVQHGYLDWKGDDNHFLCDFSVFWSDMVAQEYVSAGLEPTRILVSGCPIADAYTNSKTIDTPIISSRIRILVITTGNPGVQAYLDETWVCDYIAGVLNSLCSEQDNFDVIVKLHPGESLTMYRKYAAELISKVKLIVEIADLRMLMSNCDVVVSAPSTVVLEACLMNKPVILVPPQTKNGRHPVLEHFYGVVTANDYESIPCLIKQVVEEGPPRRPGVLDAKKYMGLVDGKSSNRLLKLINRIALGNVNGN